ncbi:chaperonin 10-like protein [Boeremia exigua]|uniref:chaperonin 10-like protein n=1 Tax=Boeremia exigua TaxID=749465 RepID=UPI001E8E825C|nr:chaperonin 10-like protein [Boeremia exigua]KAH6614318.1 chaperonin 10-like protein [Boeremia exigua]
MATHSAVATVGLKAKLELIQVPTVKPTGNKVRVRNEWTASTPLDLHQNDGGLLVTHPQVLGDGTGGTVVEVGPDVNHLKVGDKVFGFTWRSREERGQQQYVTVEEWFLGKVPDGFTLAEAVTLPNNFVTVFHAVTADLGIELPWPKSDGYMPKNADSPILIWGGSSSVGQFAIQILRYYGYTNVLATASRKHHEKLRSLGARTLFDYNDQSVAASLLQAIGDTGIPLILDCIGSKHGSVTPISQVAKNGAKVAVLLPIIVRDSTETESPIYEMDVEKVADWQAGVDARGVRTHFYPNNEFFKHHLQPDIMPAMLEQRIVEPQRQKIVEGPTLLARAQAAMDMLRRKEASMERLVWRVNDIEAER